MLSTAKIEISLDIEVSGERTPADPSVGLGEQYDAGPIIGLTYDEVEFFTIEDEHGCQIGRGSRIVATTDLLSNVDVSQPAVRQLLFNILKLYQVEADEALREANV